MLVLVHGPPGSGKTTLARALGRELHAPVVGKDDVKELLYDALGVGDVAWSQRLGTAAYSLLLLVAERQLEAGLPLVVDANWVAGAAEPLLLRLPPHRCVQVYCEASEEILMARYASRQRHEGHLDARRADEVRANIRAGRHRPLELQAPLIRLDPGAPDAPGAAALAARVRELA